ncbi:flagellar biosynthesis chaperone FliJ [Salinisphaera dokdonensis CL-ES53]|uniref:Flagellar FliJ protein n=1 Tax=Salinisphaera dokdonensis CL-ES53 TaxID=1304272 RepID=A0ABV2AYA6_9GAMM
MPATSTLDTLIDLATDERDAAASALGRLQQARRASEQKLQALVDYRAEYQRRFDDAMADGMSMSSLQNYQRFVASLEQAIDHQRRALDTSERHVETGNSNWRARQRRLNSFDVLATRRRDAAAKTEAKREQRQTDEFASRALFVGSGR